MNTPYSLFRSAQILAALLLSGLLLFTALSCGDDEVGCRTEHDCEGDNVCEPSGCATSCEEASDCPTGYDCAPRRVEEGLICTLR